MRRLVVGLDIGTTKVCAVVGEIMGEEVSVIGLGVAPSGGMKKGLVIDMSKVSESISRAIEEAEQMVDTKIQDVVVGIAGEHITGVNLEGMVAISNGYITDKDVKRVIENAKLTTSISADKQIIHIIPQEFIVDDQRGITRPQGMYGRKLKANIYVVFGNLQTVKNVVKCCENVGLQVRDIVLQSIASAEAVLYPDEREIGTVLIDIGGGTTDVAVFYSNTLVYTMEIPIGGDRITQDIARFYNIPSQHAEEAKKKGFAVSGDVSEKEYINLGRILGKETHLPRKQVSEIIQARLDEIFEKIKLGISSSPYAGMIKNAVITGGTSNLPKIDELAKRALGMQVRIGRPMNVKGVEIIDDPRFATSVGLILYASRVGLGDFKIRRTGFFERVKRFFFSLFE